MKIVYVLMLSIAVTACASKPKKPMIVYAQCENQKFLDSLGVDAVKCDKEFSVATKSCDALIPKYFDNVPKEKITPQILFDFVLGCTVTKMTIKIQQEKVEKAKENEMHNKSVNSQP